MVFFFFLWPLLLFPQANPPAAENTKQTESTTKQDDEAKKNGLDPAFVLERDISTATVQELADWCRSLGLSGEGSNETLAARLWEYYKLTKKPEAASSDETKDEGLIITIESAKTTEYFTVQSVNEEYVRLRGGVSVILKDGDTLHKIEAEEILYNRTRKLMTAYGTIIYTKSDVQGEAEKETFRGEGLTVNLDNWSIAFMGGASEREVGKDKSTYRFTGEVISRTGDDAILLRRATITNAYQEEPYWSINASSLWLLPGSDFAMVNAVFKVGEIPVFYLPGFYYPGNDVIFHPVVGLRQREGTFLQTTTYILGRPKAASNPEEIPIGGAFLGSNEGMELKPEGVFLRNMGKKAKDTNEPSLSLMADAYANLGYFAGSDLSLPAKNHFGKLDFSLGLGWSRDIYYDRGIYTPFYPDYDGTSNWHTDLPLLGLDVPFRYRFVSTGSANTSGKLVRSSSLTWKLYLYSDPFMDYDFLRRSEDSGLFNIIKNSGKDDTLDNAYSSTATYISSYIWELSGNFSFATTVLNPYVNQLSLSNTSAVTFDTRTTTTNPPAYNLSNPPNKMFFYPNKITLFNAAAVIGGTPLSLGGDKKTNPKEEENKIEWGVPVSPWDSGEAEDNGNTEDPLILRPPAFTRTTSPMALGGHNFTLSYQLSPAGSSEIKLNSNRVDKSVLSGPNRDQSWKQLDDVDWGDYEYQKFSFQSGGNVNMSLSEKRNFYTHTMRFAGDVRWQDYTYMNENSSAFDTDAKIENAKKQTHNLTSFNSTAEYGFNLRPFNQSDVWKATSFSYNVRGVIARSKYDQASDSWDIQWGEWTQEKIETNRVTANVSANVMDKAQSLSVSADIPPSESDIVDESKKKQTTLTGNLTLNAWISQFAVRSSIKAPFENTVYDPLSISGNFKFTDKLSFRYDMNYILPNEANVLNPTPAEPGFRSITTSLTWGSFTASFNASRSRSYFLDTGQNSGWKISTGAEKLNPQTLSAGYSGSKSFDTWTNFKGMVTLNTQLFFDLQRYTNSRFTFNLTLDKIKVSDILDVTLVARSENKQIYRYFRDMPFFDDLPIDMPGEKNIFLDLINSFRFDDVEKRKLSGFKFNSFNLNLIHHLGDWDATLIINTQPKLQTTGGKYEYQFISDISFVVQWKPIQEFKTDVRYTTENGLSIQ
ncbi:MAG: LPS-assembly protein LptD [Spirochaetaceae bacterium]|nr:LPS-assembly protein LptD [Spirochaetaceae bacterium]